MLEKNERIEKMKQDKADEIRMHHQQKYEVALQNIKRKELEKQLLWERNQMVLAEKYKKLKERQIERENDMKRRKVSKLFNITPFRSTNNWS